VPSVVKRSDNLKPEGAFEGREPDKWLPGERAPKVKHEDNLHMDGQFTGKAPDQVSIL